MSSRYKKVKIRSSVAPGQPAGATALLGGFGEGAETKLPISQSKSGFGEGLFKDTSGVAAPKLPFGTGGSNLPTFNFGFPSNEVKSNKNLQLKARRLVSHVYKCNACALCFDRQEVMFKHLNSCFPSKKITRIHCVCGFEFDKHNYDYHCEVHRKFAMLKKKDVTINDDVDIEVGEMAKKFTNDEEDTVSATDDFKLKADAVDNAAEDKSIFAKNKVKSCDVYRCNCRLCFERPEFLFSHLNNCDPGEKITRILCMCGLEFDKYNYDYHCEVHRNFTRLHVKKIIVSDDDEMIHISGMWQEFAKEEIKTAKITKEAQAQTEDLKELFVKSPFYHFKENSFEQVLGNKIVKAVIDIIESGIDGKESQTKITIVIANASEKCLEQPTKTNMSDLNNEVTDVRKSEMNANQKAADNTLNTIPAPTERHHDTTDNVEASNVVLNESLAPAQPENEAINSSDLADGDLKINAVLNTNDSNKIMNEISVHTVAIPAEKTINDLDTKNDGLNLSNKVTNDQENSIISTNETFGPTLSTSVNKNSSECSTPFAVEYKIET